MNTGTMRAQGVCKSFGKKTVLRELELTLEPGKLYGLLGRNGAGKSTLARALAKALGYLYVDTGAIYRTVGLQACRTGVDPEDRDGVVALLPGLDIRLGYGEDGVQRMFLNGEDVSQAIRQHEISRYAAPEARARRRWLELQQRGDETDYETVLRDVIDRDEKDTNRATAPLRQAEDAVLADTTQLDLEQSLDLLISIAKERLQA